MFSLLFMMYSCKCGCYKHLEFFFIGVLHTFRIVHPVYMYIFMYVCMYVYMYMCVCMYVYVCVYVCMFVWCVCACMYVRVVCACVCVCVCTVADQDNIFRRGQPVCGQTPPASCSEMLGRFLIYISIFRGWRAPTLPLYRQLVCMYV